LGAVRFQFQSGIEHQHFRAARPERLGTGDSRRTRTDDTVHIFSFASIVFGKWKHGNTGLQAHLKESRKFSAW